MTCRRCGKATSTTVRRLSDATDSVKVFQGNGPWISKEVTGLLPKVFDSIDLAYDVLNRLTMAVYKTGGASGTIVASLAFTYDGSSTRIATVVRT